MSKRRGVFVVRGKMKLSKFATAVSLGSLTAVAALVAGSAPAHADGAAPGGGSFPGSFLVPGTDTSFKIGGYVKGDLVYDTGPRITPIANGFDPTLFPLDSFGKGGPAAAHSVHGATQLTADESRFNIETRTPTGYGEFKTFLEGDFRDPNGLTHSSTFMTETNSSGFRIRYAYGTLGPWLVGQYNSLFRDAKSEAEELDIYGDLVAGPSRVPQFRYTYDAGDGFLIAGAIENPQTQFVDGEAAKATAQTTYGNATGEKLPDFTGAVIYNAPWGHASLRGVIRDLYDHNIAPSTLGTGVTGSTTEPGAVSASTVGWGLGVSGDYRTWGKDDLEFQANGGVGVGRYLNNNSTPVLDVVIDSDEGANAPFEAISAWEVYLSYQHWWTNTLRSTAAGSFERASYGGDFHELSESAQLKTLDSLNSRIWMTHVNLIWSPIPQVDTGIEFMAGNRKLVSGQNGEAERVQFSTKFKF